MVDLKREALPIVENEKVRLSVHAPQEGRYLIHCEVFEWSKEIFREFLDGWIEVLEEFKKAGIPELFCLIPEEETKIGKFAVMFGFEPIKRFQYQTDVGTEGFFVLYRFPVDEVAGDV